MADESHLIEALEIRAIRREGRRAFFKAALGATAVGAAGLAAANVVQAATPLTEQDYLNFALNLEYLEANFYSFAVTGNPIDASLITGASGAGVAATGGALVNFTDPVIKQLANEILEDEIAHVNYLRSELKAATVAQPQIDLSPTGAFAKAATLAGLPATFSPYADDSSFLLGAFLFEDVGVTAYGGAMSAMALLASPKYLDATSGLLSVEAQHAAAIRAELTYRGVSVGSYVASDTSQVTNAGLLSNARDSLDGASDDDQGIDPITTTQVDPRDASGATFLVQSNIAPVHDASGDADNGLTFKRTTSQVLNIVYLDSSAGAKTGGFFPAGMNGNIKSAAAAA